MIVTLITGNVGDNEALAKVAKTWARPPRCSTKELLDVRCVASVNLLYKHFYVSVKIKYYMHQCKMRNN